MPEQVAVAPVGEQELLAIAVRMQAALAQHQHLEGKEEHRHSAEKVVEYVKALGREAEDWWLQYQQQHGPADETARSKEFVRADLLATGDALFWLYGLVRTTQVSKGKLVYPKLADAPDALRRLWAAHLVVGTAAGEAVAHDTDLEALIARREAELAKLPYLAVHQQLAVVQGNEEHRRFVFAARPGLIVDLVKYNAVAHYLKQGVAYVEYSVHDVALHRKLTAAAQAAQELGQTVRFLLPAVFDGLRESDWKEGAAVIGFDRVDVGAKLPLEQLDQLKRTLGDLVLRVVNTADRVRLRGGFSVEELRTLARLRLWLGRLGELCKLGYTVRIASTGAMEYLVRFGGFPELKENALFELSLGDADAALARNLGKVIDAGYQVLTNQTAHLTPGQLERVRQFAADARVDGDGGSACILS